MPPAVALVDKAYGLDGKTRTLQTCKVRYPETEQNAAMKDFLQRVPEAKGAIR